MEDTFKIGLISRPHGVRGELKINSLTDDPLLFKKLKKVIIDGVVYGVTGVRLGADAVYLSLSGVADRNSAENFRGKFLCVSRADEEPLDEFTYYVADVIGSDVVTETGEYICTVTDVTSAKTDVFTGKTKDGITVRFPFLRVFLIKVDTVSKKIVVNEKRFSEVSLYEN